MFTLVKEIKSKKGVIHFRRYHLFSTPLFHCYLHRIYKPDLDKYLHNHPWSFWGLILWGKYIEEIESGTKERSFGSILKGKENYFHKIKEVIRPTTSLFFTGIKTNEWGYKSENGFINHEEYRKNKN